MSVPKHILAFRFSSLGDIAMTVPVIRLLLQQYPSLQVTFVSVAFVQPLFANIERLHFVAADLKGKHKGLDGLFRLYRELSSRFHYDAVADLHQVLRTQVLRLFLSGKTTSVIDKGRAEKQQLTRQQNKVLRPLPSTFERYAAVFAKLGLPVVLDTQAGILTANQTDPQWDHWKREEYKLIGIAPFAQYEEKTYPFGKMQQVINLLLKQDKTKLFLFGGKADVPALEEAARRDHVYSMAGTMSFEKELSYIAQLHAMISMDSANMHLASLYGVPVVSVWGGTHPFLGFNGWGQPLSHCVQIDLDCRPSSVFGNKPCPNNRQCMLGISPLAIAGKVWEIIT